jgi:hypothetical protein
MDKVLQMKRFLIASSLLTLAACGGGGGDTTAPVSGTPTPTPIPITTGTTPVTPITVKYSLSAYDNVKNLDFFPKSVPQWPSINGGFPMTSTLESFFKFKDGTAGYIGTLQLYNNATDAGPDTATHSLIRIWKYANGEYQFADLIDSGSATTCIHPRKILPADLNQDGNVDFVFICHGWDYIPYPGERNRVLLSQPNGRYLLDYMSEDIGFWHGGTTMDVNGDGYPDVITVNPSKTNDIRFFLNDKTGHFKLAPEMTIKPSVQPDYVPPPGWNPVPEPSVSTIDAIDINADGKHDLVVGGQDWQSPTVIMINPGNGDFTKAEQVTIPRLDTQGLGNVMDFVYTPSNKSLYILRTSGCASGCYFYRGVFVQKVSLAAGLKTNLLTSTVVYSRTSTKDYDWEPWIKETNGNISTPVDKGLFNIKVE